MISVAQPYLEHQWVEPATVLGVLVLAGLFANFVVKRLLLRGIERALKHTSFGRDDDLRRYSVIPRLANIMPALVISTGAAASTAIPPNLNAIIQNVTKAFIILTLALAISGVTSIIDTAYHRKPQGKIKPIKGYLQIARLLVYAVAAILIIATLIDRSPIILLSGLGAMAAVLILVFQDTLLSLVAGIQISSNDMVRVGDWVEIPDQNADGDVIEIALHTVKIQNWDKTITTVPIRRLVTDSVKNWRGMTESGGRRIKRSIRLDQNSTRFLSEAEIERLGHLQHLTDYLDRKRGELDAWNKALGDNPDRNLNARRLTNIGTFRAYLKAYLKNHPGIDQSKTMLVRQLEPGANGIPIEVYCFAGTTAWAEYEDIQSDIFDHVLAILPEFGLSVFQNIGSSDLNKEHPLSLVS
jgi:miniconductance mechanosensitive channel